MLVVGMGSGGGGGGTIRGGVLCLLGGQVMIWEDVSLDWGRMKIEVAYKAARCVRSFSR